MGSKTLRHSHKSISRSCHIAEQADPGLNGMKKKRIQKEGLTFYIQAYIKRID
jgi:hypothetical protein